MQELQAKAADERWRCRQSLLRFMPHDHPRFLTKAELRGAAMQELIVSENSFDLPRSMRLRRPLGMIGMNWY